MSEQGVPVVITTLHRGVFFGFLPEMPAATPDTVLLRDAQMAVYWSADTHGVLGLAAHGPGVGSRIGPPVSEISLAAVISVMAASEEAVAKWQKQIWK